MYARANDSDIFVSDVIGVSGSTFGPIQLEVMVFGTSGNSLRAAGASNLQKLVSLSEVRNSRIRSIRLVPFQGSRPSALVYFGFDFIIGMNLSKLTLATCKAYQP